MLRHHQSVINVISLIIKIRTLKFNAMCSLMPQFDLSPSPGRANGIPAPQSNKHNRTGGDGKGGYYGTCGDPTDRRKYIFVTRPDNNNI